MSIVAVPTGGHQQQQQTLRAYGSPPDSVGKIEAGGMLYGTSPQSAADLASSYPMSPEAAAAAQAAAQSYLAAAAAAVAMATPSGMKEPQQQTQPSFLFDQRMGRRYLTLVLKMGVFIQNV